MLCGELRGFLKKSLQAHEDAPYWWYHVQCVGDSKHNLSTYLGLEDDDYKSILLSLGLANASKQSKDGMLVKGDKWQNLLEECHINNVLHFSKTKIRSVGGTRNLHWIRLGTEEEGGVGQKILVQDQITSFNDNVTIADGRPSRTRSYVNRVERGPKELESLLQFNRHDAFNLPSKMVTLDRLLHEKLNSSDRTEDETDDETDDEDAESHRDKRRMHEDAQQCQVRLDKLKIILSNLASKYIDGSETVAICIPTKDLESTLLALTDITQTIAKEIQWSNPQNESALNTNKSYPILKKAGIPLRKSLLHGIIREIINISREVGDQFDFGYQSSNGKFNPCLIIPQIRSNDSFRMYAGKVIDNFVCNMVSTTKVREEVDTIIAAEPGEADNRATITDRVVEEEKGWIALKVAKYIGKKYKHAFERAGKELGYVMNDRKLDVYETTAMIHQANLSTTKLRVINSYFTKTLGYRIMPSERKLKSIQRNDDAMKFSETEVDEVTFFYYIKDIEQVLLKTVSTRLQDESIDASTLTGIDIVYSGDHGQAHFRLAFKIILRFSDGRERIEIVEDLGNMKCKKDTYELLEATLGPSMNEGVGKIMEEDKKTAKKVSVVMKDGKPFLCMGAQGDNHNNGDFVKCFRPRFRITGDLAFYSLILGKKNMSSKWCWLCDFFCAQQDWKFGDDASALTWTSQEYYAILEKVERGEKMTPREQRGVVTKPLIDVDPSIFIIPPLHIKLGLFNRAIIQPKGVSFFSWLEKRVEMVPEDELNVRDELLQHEEQKNDSRDAITLWDLRNSEEQLNQSESVEYLTEELQYPSRRHTAEDLANYKLQLKECKARSLHLKRERSILERDLTNKGKLVTLFRKRYQILIGKRPRHARMLKRVVEKILKKYGVDRGAYHGGDLIGTHITKFCYNCDAIFDEIKAKLLEYVETIGHNCLADADEVNTVCFRFRELVQLLDCFFHIHMLIPEEYSPEKEQEAKDCVLALQKRWRQLRLSVMGPKFQSLSHFVVQMIEHGGLGPFNEQFIELAHKVGNRDFTRVGQLKSPQKRAESIARMKSTTLLPEVLTAQEIFSPIKKEKEAPQVTAAKKQRRKETLDRVIQMIREGRDTVIDDYWNKRRP